MENVSIVVKLAERCNLDCSYCYVFNQGNDAYLSLPKVLNTAVRDRLPSFIRELREDLGNARATVIFHGGEPLLYRKRDFDALCTAIREENTCADRVGFNLQTNGVLINEEWVRLFRRHDVQVGVSLDGDEALNAQRAFHNGRGSYHEAVRGWRRVRDANIAAGRSVPPILCAVTGGDTVRALSHFLELGVDRCDLIMPSQTRDATTNQFADDLKIALPELFGIWWRNRGSLVVRSFRYIVYVMMAGEAGKALIQQASAGNATISIDTAGGLGPDSSLLPARLESDATIFQAHAARYYFESALGQEISTAEQTLPPECMECPWRVPCRAQGGTGNLINRFGQADRFAGKSAFCDALKALYREAARLLISDGASIRHVATSLGISDETLADAIQS